MLDNFQLDNLKKMSYDDLDNLAKEIRKTIIETCSKNGGHIASNLGVVELTIALHKVFDSPFDKIIFDVSHQTYTHKILTGRFNEFSTLRKLDGLSGFSKYEESPHDAFEAGHSSTSISAGLGFLEAKKNTPNSIGEVVAVIGDASLSNGLPFEALNYLGDHKEEKMIIIVNDNNMSISKNVGSIARRYNSLRIKKSLKLLKRITPIRIKHALQYYAYRMDLFTSLGFKYFENIDGHDIKELVKYLTFAKNSDKSIVLHIKTIKGKGYAPCENDNEGLWHGVGPFEIETGKFIHEAKSQTFGESICHELINLYNESYPIKIISPAMSLGCGFNEITHNYPSLMIDVGIAEENAVVMASSMALAGHVPIVIVYSTFLQRAYDEIIHDIARPNLHVIFCLDHAGIVPGDGDTHQGIYDMGFLSSIPGVTILQPVTALDAAKMIDYAVKSLTGPVVIRYPKGTAPIYNLDFIDLKWRKLCSGDNYIISYGPNVLSILNEIKNRNLSNIGLIDATCTSMIDESIVNALNGKTLYIYEEVIKSGSLYLSLLDYINQANLDIKLKPIYLKTGYLPEGSINELKTRYQVSLEDLFQSIKEN